APDFILTNTSGIHAIPISEQIIGVLLMLARGLHTAIRAQVKREWWQPAFAELSELSGATMLVVGFGAIGQRTAFLAGSFGMHVESIRRHPTGGAASYGPERLRERLAHADVVVLTLPLTDATKRLIGPAELQVMKPSAYLINVGRGGTVDEAALVEALRAGRIAGAALDTFTEEPLPATSPLWDLPNVIITAHYAGGTPSYQERALAVFIDNLDRYQKGTPLRNRVDATAGY
ncbi:MAG: D-2-hydroxyacid dehydrogenase, partial [Chloroflexi bacterium]|nr:D-2-hydroxyacid dehydrogenase [Chloroflexota bacterium]